ncbi:hypothetical protein QTO39_24215, partial [Escherichia coli]|uniref:hypothetical protein n=1 Tax=Escherichia coli TaxID=562 RepID=UPI0025ADD12D
FSDPGPVFHTIVSIKNDGHYFCRAGGNRPDGLNEPVTFYQFCDFIYYGELTQYFEIIGRTLVPSV